MVNVTPTGRADAAVRDGNGGWLFAKPEEQSLTYAEFRDLLNDDSWCVGEGGMLELLGFFCS
jgi:hypothetical protein